jgi:hypothetical protein
LFWTTDDDDGVVVFVFVFVFVFAFVFVSVVDGRVRRGGAAATDLRPLLRDDGSRIVVVPE